MAKNLIPSTAKVSLEELSKRIADSDLQELRVIIKGDVQLKRCSSSDAGCPEASTGQTEIVSDCIVCLLKRLMPFSESE